MKRFALKRIAALALALIMTLSLLPMTAWAETPVVFVGGNDRGCYGVTIFTDLAEDGVSLSCDSSVSQWGDGTHEYVAVNAPGETTKTVYLAVSQYDGLEIDGVEQNNPVGTWERRYENNGVSGTEMCYVYAVTLHCPVSDYTAECPVTRTYSYYDGETLIEGGETFILSVDFTPAIFYEGSPFGVNNVFFFTGKNGNVLEFDGSLTRRGDQSGEYVTVPCADGNLEKLYLAAFQSETVQVGETILTDVVGKWTTTFTNDAGESFQESLNVYEIDLLPAADGFTATTTVTRTWTWHENGAVNTGRESFTLIFDYSPMFVAEGETVSPYGIFVFTDKSGDVLTYNGAVSQRGDETGEYVTVYCMPETEKTVYFAVSPWDTLTMDGLQFVGKWNRSFITNEGNPATESYDVYSLTVDKPQDGTKAEYNATISWVNYDEATGTEYPESREVTYIFDFENYPTKLWYWQWESWRDDTVYIDRGMMGNMKLAIGTPINRTVLTESSGAAVEVLGDIGVVSWSDDGTELLLDTSVATANSGRIKVTYDGESYELPISVNFRQLFFDSDGRYENWMRAEYGFVYNWELYYEQWNDQIGQSEYFPINENDFELVGFTASGAMLPANTFVWEDDGTVTFDARALKATDFPVELLAVEVANGCFHELTIADVSGSEDKSCWKYYKTNANVSGDYQYGGNSVFVVQLTPLQAQFVDLPDQLTADNELVITVHAPSEEAWREMLDEDTMDPAIYYHFECLKGEGTSGEMPMVKAIAGSMPVEDFLKWLQSPEYEYASYAEDGHRHNGNMFAWVTSETDRNVIIPQESNIRSAWSWKYSDGTVQYDSVNVKVVLADDVSNAIVLDDTPFYPLVDADRITLNTSHTNMNTVFSTSYDETTGVVTHRYTGPVTPDEAGEYPSDVIKETVYAMAEADNMVENGDIFWPILTVSAPKAGYTAKAVGYDQYWEYGSTTMEIRYHWQGINMNELLILTWENAAGDIIKEQLTIQVPTVSGVENWLDHINDGNVSRIPAERVIVTELTEENCGAENIISDGFLYTQFNEDVMLDAEMIYNATIGVEAPVVGGKLPVAYKAIAQEDGGRDDPSYNNTVLLAGDDSKMILEATEPFELETEESTGVKRTLRIPLDALLEQNIGDIQYYYSGDRGTRNMLIKWIFDAENEDNGAIYEYIIFDTSPYYCVWETPAVDNIEDVPDNVEKPTVVFDGEIKLVSRIHPQNKSGHFFFELEVVDGDGNAYIVQEGDKFIIILPYEFMGVDKNGNPWTYETASKMKSAKIQHFDDDFTLKDNNGTLHGTFTERGIEFVVDSFSPFMLIWDEESIEDNTGGNTGGYPGYYYPIVTPEEEPAEKPAESEPVVAPTTTPPVEETVTPTPEDTKPEVKPDAPVVDDPVVDEAPAVDAEPSNNTGLWIGVGIVALAAIVVVLAVMAARKKRKQ